MDDRVYLVDKNIVKYCEICQDNGRSWMQSEHILINENMSKTTAQEQET